MIVTFTSSETGELLMFANVAATILRAIGKETSARGTFTRDEMAPAASALREAVARAAAEEEAPVEDDEEEEKETQKEPVITLGQRAWPFIDMLERTARSGPEAHIVWQAKADF